MAIGTWAIEVQFTTGKEKNAEHRTANNVTVRFDGNLISHWGSQIEQKTCKIPHVTAGFWLLSIVNIVNNWSSCFPRGLWHPVKEISRLDLFPIHNDGSQCEFHTANFTLQTSHCKLHTVLPVCLSIQWFGRINSENFSSNFGSQNIHRTDDVKGLLLKVLGCSNSVGLSNNGQLFAYPLDTVQPKMSSNWFRCQLVRL